MRIVDIIKKKRDGEELTHEEFDYVAGEYIKGNIPDYQIAAFLMAVYYKGMTNQEIVYLTKLMAKSGDKIDLSNIKGFKVDKAFFELRGLKPYILVLRYALSACRIPSHGKPSFRLCPASTWHP